jgi:Ca-activated chloride channel family protein
LGNQSRPGFVREIGALNTKNRPAAATPFLPPKNIIVGNRRTLGGLTMKKKMAFVIMFLIITLVACSSGRAFQDAAEPLPLSDQPSMRAQTEEVTRVVTEIVEVEVELAAEGEPVEWSAILATQPAQPAQAVDMFFADVGENPSVSTADDNLSTFAIDVDTGAYTLMRSYLTGGVLPPPESVRVEEYINYFDYGYPRPEDNSFVIHLDGAPAPFAAEADEYIVRVGIQGFEVPAEERPDMLLIFVVDTSGSMDGGNRLEQVKASLAMLTEQLRPGDRIGLIEYGSQARVILEPTDVSNGEQIFTAISRLEPNGSTNAEHGLHLGFQMADTFREGDQPTRLILCSDGVANVGNTTAEAILDYARNGITLSTFGFGMGNYNDVLMEQLADQGDGVYAYVDTPNEAQRLFVDNLTGTLLTIARDAKIQVEFNPDIIASYRLLGYENRAVADEDFRNDDVDAGEIGAGHSVTALYAVRPVAEAAADQEALIVRVRYEQPDTGEVVEIARRIALRDFAESFAAAPFSLQLAAVVAEYAEQLSQNSQATASGLDAVLLEAMRVAELFPGDADVQEFIDLLQMAAFRG